MTVRKAAAEDVLEIARLSSLKRKQYEKYQPRFHKESEGAMESQRNYLKNSLSKDHVIALVYSDGAEMIGGFILGTIVDSPPVYNPGGKVLFVDDFMVADPSLWKTVGKDLLDQAVDWGKEKGAVLANVVCGPMDGPKKEMLNRYGFAVASEWNIKSIE